ncbi:DUF645 family protein [Vibrio cholerae]|nr:DUF645 family protein [Vibrio cholerae]TQP42023.1 DUF645 family protein [Vibrio cholerae]
MLLDVQRGQLGFTKGCIVAEIVLSLLEIRLLANLTLNAMSFGSLLHSFWRWTCVCSMHLCKIIFKQMCLKSHCETIGYEANKRLKRDCQRAAFPVPMSRGGCSCCV